jgi:RND superfamily putative drug exporter
MEHAGSAVVFSGTTVAIALLALVALPVPFLRNIGIAGMLITLVSVAVAIYAAAGDPGHDRAALRLAADPPGGWWQPRLVGVGSDRRAPRWAAAIGSAGALVALVATSSIQLGNARAESLAQSGAARAGFEQLDASGIGAGPRTPFEALVRGATPTRSPRGSPRSKVSALRSPRRSGGVTVPPSSPSSRPWTETQRGGTRRSTALAPPRAKFPPTSSRAARSPKAPTSSTPSTATSRS